MFAFVERPESIKSSQAQPWSTDGSDKLSFWVLKDLLRFPYYFYSWTMLEFTSHGSQFKLL